jgi:hypothetical protein
LLSGQGGRSTYTRIDFAHPRGNHASVQTRPIPAGRVHLHYAKGDCRDGARV